MTTMLKNLKAAAVTVNSEMTVLEVAELMTQNGVNAIVVTLKGKLLGIVSERDLVRKVMAKRLKANDTKVTEIMTAPVRTVLETATPDDALTIMFQGQCRHLPVVDSDGQVVGMVSVRELLNHRIHELDLENKTLQAFVSADGPGG